MATKILMPKLYTEHKFEIFKIQLGRYGTLTAARIFKIFKNTFNL